MQYDTSEYAASRLDQTMVRTKGGVPVWIKAVRNGDAGIEADITYLTTGKGTVKKLEALDLTPPALGFINVGLRTSYIVRQPLRHDWRQGTRYPNLVSHFGYNPGEIQWKQYEHCIRNKYPKIDKAYQVVSDNKGSSMAFHREWAFYNDPFEGKKIVLLHRGRKVGTYKDNAEFDERYVYLRDAFEEVANG